MHMINIGKLRRYEWFHWKSAK